MLPPPQAAAPELKLEEPEWAAPPPPEPEPNLRRVVLTELVPEPELQPVVASEPVSELVIVEPDVSAAEPAWFGVLKAGEQAAAAELVQSMKAAQKANNNGDKLTLRSCDIASHV